MRCSIQALDCSNNNFWGIFGLAGEVLGNIEYLDCSNNGLTDLNSNTQFSGNLKYLNLSHNAMFTVINMLDLFVTKSSNITHIDLSYNQFYGSELNFSPFDYVEQLEVNLKNNYFTSNVTKSEIYHALTLTIYNFEDLASTIKLIIDVDVQCDVASCPNINHTSVGVNYDDWMATDRNSDTCTGSQQCIATCDCRPIRATTTTTPTTATTTSAPTTAPTEAYNSGSARESIYIYYNQDIQSIFSNSFSIGEYATHIGSFTMDIIVQMMNDTYASINTACEGADPDGIDCELTEYYSYNNDIENGWRKGRIENLQFCVVFENLVLSIDECDEYYDKSRFFDSKEFKNNEAQFIAFATYDVVAETNVDNFYNYFKSKFRDNGTTFVQTAEIIKNKATNETVADWSTFEIVSVTIGESFKSFEEAYTDTFEQFALDLTFGLYGFMGVCVILAIWAKLDAFCVGADHVKSMRIVFFGVWTWDFFSDIIFTSRAFEQKFYLQAILGLVFVILPWISNIILLIKSEREWTRDSTIKYQVSRWLLRYNKKLLLLTFICGSAFAAVEFCNSRAFGMQACLVFSLYEYSFCHTITVQVVVYLIWD